MAQRWSNFTINLCGWVGGALIFAINFPLRTDMRESSWNGSEKCFITCSLLRSTTHGSSSKIFLVVTKIHHFSILLYHSPHSLFRMVEYRPKINEEHHQKLEERQKEEARYERCGVLLAKNCQNMSVLY